MHCVKRTIDTQPFSILLLCSFDSQIFVKKFEPEKYHIVIMWSHIIHPTDHDLPGDEQRSKPLEADPRRALSRHQFKNSPFLAEGPT